MATPMNIAEQRRTLGALLKRPFDVMVDRVYARMAGVGFAGLRPAHSSVFRNMDAEGSQVSELAERARMTKQSMAYLVDGLAAAGYVTVTPHPSDGRAKLVRLTERGREAWDALAEQSAAEEAELAALIGRDEMARLRALLERLFDRLP